MKSTKNCYYFDLLSSFTAHRNKMLIQLIVMHPNPLTAIGERSEELLVHLKVLDINET
jgi:hypothetical protein